MFLPHFMVGRIVLISCYVGPYCVLITCHEGPFSVLLPGMKGCIVFLLHVMERPNCVLNFCY